MKTEKEILDHIEYLTENCPHSGDAAVENRVRILELLWVLGYKKKDLVKVWLPITHDSPIIVDDEKDDYGSASMFESKYKKLIRNKIPAYIDLNELEDI